jgi:hypothetical protein
LFQAFNLTEFSWRTNSGTFNRKAPYASIRFSYHKGLNDQHLRDKLEILKSNDYNIGVWGLNHVDNSEMKEFCKTAGIDYREKEFLDADHGTYKYPDAVSGNLRSVMCKPNEFLIAPDGKIYRCHADLYAGRNPTGHILDEEVKFEGWKFCDKFGTCSSCDAKLKTDRFQRPGYCSVEIRECD